MTEVSTYTAAGRVYHILQRLREIGNKNQNKNIKTIWSLVFEVDAKPRIWLKSYCAFLQQIELINTELEYQNFDSQTYFLMQDDIWVALEELPTQSTWKNANTYNRLNQEKILKNLKSIDNMLMREREAPALTVDFNTQKLEATIQELIREIKASNWDKEIKDSLIQDLMAILSKVRHKIITGINEISNEAQRTLKKAHSNEETKEVFVKTPLGKKIQQLLCALMLLRPPISTLTDVVTIAQIPMIIEYYQEWDVPKAIPPQIESLLENVKETKELPPATKESKPMNPVTQDD